MSFKLISKQYFVIKHVVLMYGQNDPPLDLPPQEKPLRCSRVNPPFDIWRYGYDDNMRVGF